MANFRLNRRALLRGAGGIAIALPFLEIMAEGRSARATGVPAKRFVAVYTPGGTVHESVESPEQWTPTGSESDFVLSPILSPYEPVKKNLVVLQGVDMLSAIGEQSESGLIAWLTGSRQDQTVTRPQQFATAPSIDQVLAPALRGSRPLKSLELALRWGTGKAFGAVHPTDIANFAADASFTPMAPELDPTQVWKQLFGMLPPPSTKPDRGDKSILDYLDRRYAALSARLGASDKRRIDQHLTHIRELEGTLGQISAARCQPPKLIDSGDYDPYSSLKAAGDIFHHDVVSDAAVPRVGKFMLDLLVMALACDQTAVATFMWTDTEARVTYPWLGLTQDFAFYQNHGGYHPPECAAIGQWYASQNSYLLQQMAAVDLGGHSLLDESIVFFGSEVSNPANHKKTDMPFLLAGGGGGLRGNRFLRYEGASHNDLLVSICNLFGDPRTTFGDPAYCTGPLTNLA